MGDRNKVSMLSSHVPNWAQYPHGGFFCKWFLVNMYFAVLQLTFESTNVSKEVVAMITCLLVRNPDN